MPKADEVLQHRDEFKLKGAYVPSRQLTAASTREQWRAPSGLLDLNFLIPEEAGTYPVIVYLPGLGEDANGGLLWRETWARAGYAVISVQPVKSGDAVRRLGHDDLVDLHGIGRRHFAKSDLDGRVAAIQWFISELRHRKAGGGSLTRKMDTDHLALAGYDLGAQTAATLAGEQDRKGPHPEKALNPVSVILLSPHVDLAAGNINSRFAQITLPVLSITGQRDDDPWGMTSPSLRTALYEVSSPGNKMLLQFHNGNHRQLSGTDPYDTQEGLPWERREGELDPEYADQQDEAVLHGNGGQAGNPGGRSNARPKGTDQRHYGQELAAIEAITTAYLDMTVRDENAAKEWLRSTAPSWIRKIGVLEHR